MSLENSAKKIFFVWDGYVQRELTIFDFRRCLEEDYVFCKIMRDFATVPRERARFWLYIALFFFKFGQKLKVLAHFEIFDFWDGYVQ